LLNIALAQVIEGRNAEAEATYRQAIARALDRHEEGQLLADAVTDLELAGRFRPELRESVDQFKQFVVSAFASRPQAARDRAAIVAIVATSFPGLLEWTAKLPDLDTAQDSVTQIWYHRDRDQRWSAVPIISRAVQFQVPDGPVTFDLESAGSYFADSDYASAFERCLPKGEYRVEVYVNGLHVGTSPSITSEEAKEADAEHIGILACTPADWDRVGTDDSQAGYVDAWTSKNHDRGLVLARIHYARDADAPKQAAAALNWLSESGVSVLPADNAAAEVSDVQFFGLDSTALGYFIVGGTHYWGVSGVTDEGTVLAAVLYGPEDFVSGDLAVKYAISYVQKTTLRPRSSP
jgi:hypothetical protein